MRSMLGFALVFGLIGLAGAGATAAEDKVDTKRLIGKWEPKEAPPGVKVVVEFAKDDKLTVSVEAGGKAEKIEGKYKLDGNKLSVDIAGKKETNTITKLTDDEVTMKDEKGKEESLKKVKAGK